MYTDSERSSLADSFRWCAAHPAEGPVEVPSVRVADEWNRLQEALLDDYDPYRFQYRDVWVALADLAEGPVCEMDLTDTYKPSDGPAIRTWECSRCGRSCEEAYGSYERCPHCGARVTKENGVNQMTSPKKDVYIPEVVPFKGSSPDKATAVKPLEEAAEAYAAWQAWDEGGHEAYQLEAIVSECADVVQATCNLLASLGVTDLGPAMRLCERRNRERGRY